MKANATRDNALASSFPETDPYRYTVITLFVSIYDHYRPLKWTRFKVYLVIKN